MFFAASFFTLVVSSNAATPSHTTTGEAARSLSAYGSDYGSDYGSGSFPEPDPQCEEVANDCCSWKYPCDIGEGVCNDNYECAAELICGDGNCAGNAAQNCCETAPAPTVTGEAVVEASVTVAIELSEPDCVPDSAALVAIGGAFATAIAENTDLSIDYITITDTFCAPLVRRLAARRLATTERAVTSDYEVKVPAAESARAGIETGADVVAKLDAMTDGGAGQTAFVEVLSVEVSKVEGVTLTVDQATESLSGETDLKTSFSGPSVTGDSSSDQYIGLGYGEFIGFVVGVSLLAVVLVVFWVKTMVPTPPPAKSRKGSIYGKANAIDLKNPNAQALLNAETLMKRASRQSLHDVHKL